MDLSTLYTYVEATKYNSDIMYNLVFKTKVEIPWN